MTTLTPIHCFSCGHNSYIEEVPQKVGKPLKRCKNCRSLNFRPLHETVAAETIEDYRRILMYVVKKQEIGHDQR